MDQYDLELDCQGGETQIATIVIRRSFAIWKSYEEVNARDTFLFLLWSLDTSLWVRIQELLELLVFLSLLLHLDLKSLGKLN